MRSFILGGLMLVAAAPAAESKSAMAQCKGSCSVNYSACLKRTTTKKGRAQCKLERKACSKGRCGGGK